MISYLRRLGTLLLFGSCLALGSMAARADPPYRVARLSYEHGSVSFSPAGEADWSRAPINRPLERRQVVQSRGESRERRGVVAAAGQKLADIGHEAEHDRKITAVHRLERRP